MDCEMKTCIGYPIWRCRWWLRTRRILRSNRWDGGLSWYEWNRSASGFAMKTDSVRIMRADGSIEPVVSALYKFYVPWWAWPLELIHRAIFGRTTLFPA